jgi:hypothetical protein
METAVESVQPVRRTLSCVVPIYNVEKYLACCLESIARQSHKDFECICVDDGSTDGGAAIAREFCTRDARFVLVQQKNRGLAAARNRGIEQARGSFVTFVDSDDYLHPEAFEVLLEIAASSKADLVCCGNVVVPEYAALPSDPAPLERRAADLVTGEPLMSVLRGLAPVGPSACGKLYSASLLERCRFDEDLRIHEDTCYSIEVLRKATRMAHSDAPIYCYRTRPGSLTAAKNYEASLKNLAAAAMWSRRLATGLGLQGQEESALLMLGGVEAFSMIAVELALDLGLSAEDRRRLLGGCATLLGKLRGEGILARVSLPMFLSSSLFIAYRMRLPRLYACAYHFLFALRNALRRRTGAASSAVAP